MANEDVTIVKMREFLDVVICIAIGHMKSLWFYVPIKA